MSLDATEVKLTKTGRIEINEDGFVVLSGFAGENCSCRDVAVLAMCHGLEVLAREVRATIEKPGGGNNGVG